jgi:hypothetical protein
LMAAETGRAEAVAASADAAVTAGQVKTFADVALRYDRFIAELRAQGLDEAEIRRQAADMFARLKEQLPTRPTAFAVRQTAAGGLSTAAPAEDYYSVVLKSSGDKERLTKRLSAVLRRGLTATRMAVDMVPGIIIYKSKESDIQAAVAIFEEERLHYSILKGDFATEVPVEKLIPGFAAMDSGLQLVFRDTPAALWLGERVCLVVGEMELEGEPATLAATDRGLYIFGGFVAGQRPQWRIIPYSRLADAVRHSGRHGALELVYHEPGREEWLRIADEALLDRVHEHIRLALGRDG